MKANTAKPQSHHRYLADDDDFEEYDSVGIDGLLAASEKLLAINRGLAEPDVRDALPNDRIHMIHRQLSEQVKLDRGKTMRQLAGRMARAKSLRPLTPNAFGEYTIGYITSNPLVPALEEINPMHNLEQKRRITKMGPGGIGDDNAVTVDMQSVSTSQFGFVDPLAGPESGRAGIDVRLANGAKVGSDGKIYQIVLNRRTGKPQWVSPTDLEGKTVKIPD